MAKRQPTVGTRGAARPTLPRAQHVETTLTGSERRQMSLEELAVEAAIERAVRKAGGKLPTFFKPDP